MIVSKFPETMGTRESFVDWHKEFAARERALQDRLRAEAEAVAAEERRLAALDPFSVGAQIEVIQGFYKGRIGTVTQRLDNKVCAQTRVVGQRDTEGAMRGRGETGAGPARRVCSWPPWGETQSRHLAGYDNVCRRQHHAELDVR